MCSLPSTSAGWLPTVWCEEILRAQLLLGELQACCTLYRVGYSNKFISGVLELLVNVEWTLFPIIYVLTLFAFNIKDTAIEVLLTNFVKIHTTYCKVRCANSRNDQNMFYLSTEKIRLSSFSCLSPVICYHPKIDFVVLFHIFSLFIFVQAQFSVNSPYVF